MILPATAMFVRSLVARAISAALPSSVESIEFVIHSDLELAENISAVVSEIANSFALDIHISISGNAQPPPAQSNVYSLPLVEHFDETDNGEDAEVIDFPVLESFEPPARAHGPQLAPIPLPVTEPDIAIVFANDVDEGEHERSRPAMSHAVARVPTPTGVHVGAEFDGPVPRRFAVARGMLAALLVVLPVVVLPLLASPALRIGAWAAEFCALMIVAGYAVGRMRSYGLHRFSLRRSFAAFGQLLANPTSAIALALFLLGGSVVLAPNNLQFGVPNEKSSKGQKPIVQHTEVIRKETVLGGSSVRIEDLVVNGTDETDSLQERFSQSRAPERGYHWTIVRVEVTNHGAKIDLGRGSARLIDETGRVYLPDMGEGVTNAPGGFLEQGGTAFWVSGYLVKDGTDVDRIELIPTLGSTEVAVMTFSDPHNTVTNKSTGDASPPSTIEKGGKK
jgi:hypothetical protein